MSAAGTGSTKRPLRVAIIGSGPAAFYAAEGLLRHPDLAVRVDMFERLPTPFGLVRGGVAPDHQSIKAVSRVFERTATRPGFRFFGNVTFGDALHLSDVAAYYDQVVYAVGSATDRKLGVPGESLAQCIPSSSFVGWYNAHPAYRDLHVDLSGVRRVAVIGNGNVAIDVARILARGVDELVRTDIADHALEVLRQSNVEEVVLFGRRGPVQAAFSPAELKELGHLAGVDLVVAPEELVLDAESARELEQAEPRVQRNLKLLRDASARGEGEQRRKVRLRFCVSPIRISEDDQGRVSAIELERNRLERRGGQILARGTNERERLDVQLVVPAIGLRAVPLPEVPFDEASATIPNDEGRVRRPETATGDLALLREYVVGWARSGPKGLIGSHKSGSEEVVARMIEDLMAGKVAARELPELEGVPRLLASRGVSFVDYAEWRRLDLEEIARGTPHGAPRRKVVDLDEMLALMGKQPDR